MNIQAKIKKEIIDNNPFIKNIVYECHTECSNELWTEILVFININYVKGIRYRVDTVKLFADNGLVHIFRYCGKIIGTAITKRSTLMIGKQKFTGVEGNFLCIQESLTKMNIGKYVMATIMFETCVRVENFQISYCTVSYQITTKVCFTRSFYHYPINDQYLYNAGFMVDTPNKPKHIKYKTAYKLDVSPDIEKIYAFYMDYQDKTFDIYQVLTLDEFSRMFNTQCLLQFVVTDNTGNICGYFCFVDVSSILSKDGNDFTIKNKTLYMAAYKGNVYHLLHFVLNRIKDTDVITFQDFLQIDYPRLGCVSGNGKLHQVIYNYRPIHTSSSLVTI